MGALDAFSRAGVKHVVYLSCAGEFTSPQGVAGMLREWASASVVVKVAVEQRLWHAAYPFKWTVVGPTLFFEIIQRHGATGFGEGLLAFHHAEPGALTQFLD